MTKETGSANPVRPDRTTLSPGVVSTAIHQEAMFTPEHERVLWESAQRTMKSAFHILSGQEPQGDTRYAKKNGLRLKQTMLSAGRLLRSDLPEGISVTMERQPQLFDGIEPLSGEEGDIRIESAPNEITLKIGALTDDETRETIRHAKHHGHDWEYYERDSGLYEMGTIYHISDRRTRKSEVLPFLVNDGKPTLIPEDFSSAETGVYNPFKTVQGEMSIKDYDFAIKALGILEAQMSG